MSVCQAILLIYFGRGINIELDFSENPFFYFQRPSKSFDKLKKIF